MPAIKSAKNAAKKQAKELASRPILYPKPDCFLFSGDKALTVQQAKDYLEWAEETDEIKFGKEFLLKDRNGNKIRCYNNPNNRPFYQRQACEPIVRSILNKEDWRLNGETIIIGKTGLVLNGQHQLVALILAEQDRTGERSAYWKKIWGDTPVSIEKFVVVGVEEDDKTMDTMDTCRPRSLADVLYRSGYFANKNSVEREKLSNITALALKQMWKRTGHFMRNRQEVETVRTHPESMDYLKRHEKLLEAVKHIYEENEPDKTGREPGEPMPDAGIQPSLGCGLAASLLYLMGSSASDPTAYYHAESPTEKKLDFSMWDKACEFWVQYKTKDQPDMKPLREAIAALKDDEFLNTSKFRFALFVNAWNQWSQGGKLTKKNIYPEIETLESGSKKLAFEPTVNGGIDLGTKTNEENEDEDEVEEVEERKSSVKEEKEEKELAAVSANGDGETDEDENG